MASAPPRDGKHASEPIVPPMATVDFPYPQDPCAKIAAQETIPAPNADPSKPPPEHTTLNGFAPSTSPQLGQKRPNRLARALTERPTPAQRASILGIQRRYTAEGPTDLDNVIWPRDASDSDSESSSSYSDEDDRGDKGARSRGSQKGRKRLSIPGMGSAKKTSTPTKQRLSRFNIGNDSFRTKGRVSKKDGRLIISIRETANRGYLAKALGAGLTHHLRPRRDEDEKEVSHHEIVRERHDLTREASNVPEKSPPTEVPKLNIVVMVIGSRGDIQPFIKIGKELKERGHRVRIATHPAFKKFVEQDSGLEFFSVGGDPAELMAFMVKNPGLIPSIETLKAGDIGRRREQMFEMFQGFWRACINATDDEHDIENVKMMGKMHPFVADAIIANPPSFAHIHCAERLGIPLHLMFTFPYSPTQAFPHPLANIKKSNIDTNYVNFMSYPLVEMMTWQGLGDLVNRFRMETLGLDPVSTLWAPGQLFRLKVSYTYLWSPGLIPKPEDWGPEIDIAGFVFLELANTYKPPDGLVKFLDDGPPPVYIGFGSIVVDDPDKFTALIFQAVKKAGVRALVSKGWGGLGDDNVPDEIYMLDNIPHDWLFPRVSAVVHHGGAGTTAIGLKCGKPTMIVPFFGDQQFWGSMIARAGAGAHEPIPYKKLTIERLAEGIQECLSPDAQKAAQKIAEDISKEGDGAANAVESFHQSLQLRGERSMRCSILPDRVAVWQLKGTRMRLSPIAAEILVERKKLSWKDLRLLRHKDWNDFDGPGEPVTGAGMATMASLAGMAKGVGGMPIRWAKSAKKKEEHEERKRKRRESSRSSSRPSMDPKRHDHTKRSISPRKRDDIEPVQSTGTAATQDTRTDDPNARRDVRPHPIHSLIHPRTHFQSRVEDHPANRPEKGESDNENMDQRSPGRDDIDQNGIGVSSPADSVMIEDDHRLSRASTDTVPLAQDLLEDTGHALAETGGAIAKAPMELSLAVAQGFHNAPRLYGDTTVRRPPRVSGYKSGLRAAEHEFIYGIFDGWTGLVVQPYRGARDEGALGFVKGTGKGFGGFVLKNLAAILGPFGYTLKGLHKELQKSQQPTAFIRRARIIQGQKDLRALLTTMPQETIDEVLNRVARGWRVYREVRAALDDMQREGLKGKVQSRRELSAWRAYGALESVDQAERALEAKQRGLPIEKVFERQRQELLAEQAARQHTDPTMTARGGTAQAQREKLENDGDIDIDIDSDKEKDKDEDRAAGTTTRSTSTTAHSGLDHQQYPGKPPASTDDPRLGPQQAGVAVSGQQQ